MRQCEVVQIDQATRDFVATARVTLGTAQALEVNDPARDLLLNALHDAFNVLDTREPFDERFYESVEPAHAALRAGIAQAGAPLTVRLTATGHAHIDVAWLWALDQTRRKAGRTFHTVLRLMEQFPDYHFTQSQPQLYDDVRRDYPTLFDAIKQRVAEGRWEPIGGMWVEADCNLSGAESLARQFLLGRSFFREHFGPAAESPVLWLPDVFGYSAALPQLIKQAGLDYFFTIKIGWNQYNRLPHDSFWWQGLDGTRVLTHFSTTTESDTARASTYNAPGRPEDVRRTWTHFQQKAIQHEVFMTFGYGDGGGGPTRDMLENLRGLQAFPAMPQVRQRAALDFFCDLERKSGAKKIDVVYFDTCLMGMIEDAYQLRGLADYMVASENLGWSFFPYQQHVQSITAATSPRQLAQALTDTYFGSGPLPRTVAAIDLAAVAQTGAAIGNLGQALHTYLQNGGNPWAIFNARENVQVFDSRDYGVLTSNDEYVDIYHLAQRLATEVITDTAVQTAAQAVLTATQQAVAVEHHQSGWALGNYWNLDNAHGLSIYFPRQSGGWDYYNYVNPQVVTTTWQFTSQTLWDEFLRQYFLTGITPPEPPDGFDGLGEVQIPHYGIYLPLVRR